MIECKAGDEVALESGYGAANYDPVTVVRVTPSGRIVVQWGRGERTFRKDGYSMGESGWGRSRILPMTDDIRQQIERRRLETMLSNAKWSAQPIEKLRQIAAILEG